MDSGPHKQTFSMHLAPLKHWASISHPPLIRDTTMMMMMMIMFSDCCAIPFHWVPFSFFFRSFVVMYWPWCCIILLRNFLRLSRQIFIEFCISGNAIKKADVDQHHHHFFRSTCNGRPNENRIVDHTRGSWKWWDFSRANGNHRHQFKWPVWRFLVDISSSGRCRFRRNDVQLQGRLLNLLLLLV